MMREAMRDAVLAAIPDAADRLMLTEQISTIEQVAAMTDAELVSMAAAHDAEVVSLTGRIEVSNHPRWKRSATQALRVLYMHRQWIVREQRKRERAQALAQQKAARSEAAAARAANLKQQAENISASRAKRLEIVKAANDSTARQIALFKEVAREVLGAEMYAHLWQLTEQRDAERRAQGAPDA